MKQLSIPLFPLNGAIIFPGTNLPLSIFEERYLSMVDYALATERLIGIIQSSDKGSLFSVGCFGKINSFNETVGNRYIINVLGKHYFKIIKHKKTSKNFIKDINAQIDFEIIDKINNEELVKFIAMSCPFSKEDKQMLLETYDLNDMGNKLVSLFEFYPTASANKKSLN